MKGFSVFSPGGVDSRERISGQDAANLLGVTSKTVKQMVQDGRLAGMAETCGTRTFVVIERSAVEDFIAKPVQRMTIEQAAILLKITRAQAKVLIKNRVLATSNIGSLTTVDRKAVDDLISRIEKKAEASTLNAFVTPLDRLPRKRGVYLSDAVVRILSGTLLCYRIAHVVGEGFASFGVNIDDLLGYRHNRGDDIFCSAERCAETLQMSDRMVSVLVDHGCLDGLRTNKHIAVRSITMRSIVAFKEKYVGATELAQAWSTNTRTVISRLRDAGVEQFIESNTKRGISAIWLRSEVDAANISREPLGRVNNRSWRRRAKEKMLQNSKAS